MKSFFKSLYLQQRLFIIVLIMIVLFVASYFYSGLFFWIQMLFFGFLGFIALDVLLLYKTKNGVNASRTLPEKLSNGDDNPIVLSVHSEYPFQIFCRVIDELPVQFQRRDFDISFSLSPRTSREIDYTLRPVERGQYHFGAVHIFSKTKLGLIARRQSYASEAMVPTYPSFLQLKKYEFIAFTNRLQHFGLKKIRRIGHTMEFEQIKDYVPGDDIRTINWKATAKRNHLMVNQFQDEKSQPVYSVIDMGRVMQMPFNRLSLLDYAINATLVISSIALKKQDKAGFFTFSKQLQNTVVAQRRPSQMNLIMESLYAIRTKFEESSFERLYVDIKRTLNQRSLLLLYTNFETLDALERQIKYLQAIAKHHLLVVIFFKNTELIDSLEQSAESTLQIYEKTIIEKFIYEKKMIVNELQNRGIHTILTSPEDLTINTINKYLEIKARGLL